jgi:DNA-binding transcriptional LysR family regulator
VIEAVVHTWLPDLLGRLRQQFPKVRVEIHSYMTAHLHAELLNGNIDLALTAETLRNPAIQSSSICGLQMGWITARTATEDQHVSHAELLSRLPILTFLPDSLVYRDVVAKLGPYSVARINPISSIAAMAALARTGYGVATLPRAAVAPALDSGELVVLDGVPDLTPLPIVASRRKQSESPLAEAIVSLAIEAAHAYSSGGRADLVIVDGDTI